MQTTQQLLLTMYEFVEIIVVVVLTVEEAVMAIGERQLDEMGKERDAFAYSATCAQRQLMLRR